MVVQGLKKSPFRTLCVLFLRDSNSRAKNVPFSSVVQEPLVITDRYNCSITAGLPVLQYVLLKIRQSVSYFSGLKSLAHRIRANCFSYWKQMRVQHTTILIHSNIKSIIFCNHILLNLYYIAPLKVHSFQVTYKCVYVHYLVIISEKKSTEFNKFRDE